MVLWVGFIERSGSGTITGGGSGPANTGGGSANPGSINTGGGGGGAGSINIGGGAGGPGSINIGGGGNPGSGSLNIGGGSGRGVCLNGGTLVRQGLPCACLSGYSGNRCEISPGMNGIGGCSYNPCKNGGVSSRPTHLDLALKRQSTSK